MEEGVDQEEHQDLVITVSGVGLYKSCLKDVSVLSQMMEDLFLEADSPWIQELTSYQRQDQAVDGMTMILDDLEPTWGMKAVYPKVKKWKFDYYHGCGCFLGSKRQWEMTHGQKSYLTVLMLLCKALRYS